MRIMHRSFTQPGGNAVICAVSCTGNPPRLGTVRNRQVPLLDFSSGIFVVAEHKSISGGPSQSALFGLLFSGPALDQKHLPPTEYRFAPEIAAGLIRRHFSAISNSDALARIGQYGKVMAGGVLDIDYVHARVIFRGDSSEFAAPSELTVRHLLGTDHLVLPADVKYAITCELQ